jgi:glycosyltransferase involved in cell wall biosynthesis
MPADRLDLDRQSLTDNNQVSSDPQVPEISIIVPCLNEEENVTAILKALNDVVVPNGLSVEVVLIDDFSDDDTFKIALNQVPEFPALHLRVIRRYQPRRGYGAVIRYGIAHARGKYCVCVSADCVDPLHLLPHFLEKKRNGVDLVQCSRYVNVQDKETLPWKFRISHLFYRGLVRLLIGPGLSDTTYPFRMFNRVDVLALGISQNTFSISPEIFFKILLNGGKIEYLAHSQGVRQRGLSKFRFRIEGTRYGYVLIRAWLHKLGLILWF